MKPPSQQRRFAACFAAACVALFGVGLAHGQNAPGSTPGTYATSTTSTSTSPRAPSVPTPQGPAGHGAAVHGGAAGHGAAAEEAFPVVTGSPFTSADHRRVAEHLRSGRSLTPKVQNQPGQGIPAGTIGMLVRDGNLQPVADQKVTLNIVRESIADGNRESSRQAVTDAEGRAGFVDLNTESSYKYEAIIEHDGARYTSGAFNLRREVGQLIALYVYPSTDNIEQTFLISRALYAVQPREDVFQVDAILRFHNGGPRTFLAKDFYINLPEGAGALRPATDSELRTRSDGNRVHITGSLTPGQHDLTFGFQLPNPRTATIRLELPTLPNLVDARVVVEVSEQMSLQVEGFDPAQETRGQQGQSALMASKDYLGAGNPAGTTIAAVITGMPGRGSGPWVASTIAALLAMLGVAFAVSRNEDKDESSLSQEDRTRARELLLDELLAVEKAFVAKEIGPKTYDQARRTLLDSIARLDSTLN